MSQHPVVTLKVHPPENDAVDKDESNGSHSLSDREDTTPAPEGSSVRSFQSKLPRPVCVTKIDPPDSSEKDDSGLNQDRTKQCSPSAQVFTPVRSGNPILRTSRFSSSFSSNSYTPKTRAFGASKGVWGSTGSSGLVSSPKPLLLRPSQLAVGAGESQQTPGKNLFRTSPFEVKNPFMKATVSPEKDAAQISDHRTKISKSGDTPPSDKTKVSDEDSISQPESSNDSNAALPSSRLVATPKFVPLGSPATHKDDSSSSGAASAAPSAVTGFVFGQNLHERVESVTVENNESSSSNSTETIGTSNCFGSNVTTNGTSEMLFTSVICKDQNNEESSERPSKSLSEAAREYEEARAVKRKFEEVAVVTGEEGEVNILQINCKLFAYDKGNWLERGRGTLRVNDFDGPEGMQSRVVIRATGSLRVVLNTLIWPGMVAERPSSKSVRLTAMDNTGQIKVFLVMAGPKEADQLHQVLQNRVASQRQVAERRGASVVDEDLSPRQLPPEPEMKKRPSQVEDTGDVVPDKAESEK
ncbi:ran-binding protein 3 [Anabrus simplex]|uniref:ran-binding protein 3 n=1 Tax=Anabrus simplex TaxID=316456 RepID=UPI0035A2AA77